MYGGKHNHRVKLEVLASILSVLSALEVSILTLAVPYFFIGLLP